MPLNPGSAREEWDRPTVRIDWWHGRIHPLNVQDDDLDAPARFLRGDLRTTSAPRGFGRVRCQRWTIDQCGSFLGERFVLDTHVDEIDVVKRFLILKGTGIQEMRHEGTYDRQLLEHLDTWGGKTNRIDLAIDVLHPDVTPLAMRDLYENGRIVTRAKNHGWDQGVGNGGTFYLRTQHRTLRAYDKSAERARKPNAPPLPAGVTRFEVEYHDRPARAIFRALCKVDASAWDEKFPALAIGWLLDFARPLDGPRPERNPNRAPTWKALDEAMIGLGPVRLNASVMRTHEEALRSRLDHAKQQSSAYRMIGELLGEGTVLQMIRSAPLNDEQQSLLDRLRTNPELARAIARAAGLNLPAEDDDTDALLPFETRHGEAL